MGNKKKERKKKGLDKDTKAIEETRGAIDEASGGSLAGQNVAPADHVVAPYIDLITLGVPHPPYHTHGLTILKEKSMPCCSAMINGMALSTAAGFCWLRSIAIKLQKSAHQKPIDRWRDHKTTFTTKRPLASQRKKAHGYKAPRKKRRKEKKKKRHI